MLKGGKYEGNDTSLIGKRKHSARFSVYININQIFYIGGKIMKKKPAKILLIAICALVVLWGVMFTTDYIRCSSLQEPLFVIPIGELCLYSIPAF